MVTAMNRSTSLRISPRFLLAFLVAAALPAHAGLYKCETGKGAVVYQDGPCEPGRELRNLELDPAHLSVVPGTPVPRKAERREPAPRTEKARTVATRIRGGNAAERKFLRTGMTAAEVVARVGRPDMQSSGRHREGSQWSYLPTAGDADTLTTVVFASGTVSRVERRIVR
jgi:hypothetical protein